MLSLYILLIPLVWAQCNPLVPGAPPDHTAKCTQWLAAKTKTDGAWNGVDASCNAGTMTTQWQNDYLQVLTAYRALANLTNTLVLDATQNANAQQCALMMEANSQLCHEPPTTWKCYTAAGYDGAYHSNIAGAPAISALPLYFQDPGSSNAAYMAHRRWFLSNSLQSTGVGSTGRYSCSYVTMGNGNVGATWTSWPGPGTMPYDAMNFDTTGWTIQSDYINVSAATVQVVQYPGAISLPVTNVRPLIVGYGSRYGLGFNANGWSSNVPNTQYSVAISAPGHCIQWVSWVVNCSGLSTNSPTPWNGITPTRTPSGAPTTALPTTLAPSNAPSPAPTTLFPSGAPTKKGSPSTQIPTPVPSAAPNVPPTTSVPSAAPSAHPSAYPSLAPSPKPSPAPTPVPSAAPSAHPTPLPSAAPNAPPTTSVPSAAPSAHPSLAPSAAPSAQPTPMPSADAGTHPTLMPSAGPTPGPTSGAPTGSPTIAPSTNAPTPASVGCNLTAYVEALCSPSTCQCDCAANANNLPCPAICALYGTFSPCTTVVDALKSCYDVTPNALQGPRANVAKKQIAACEIVNSASSLSVAMSAMCSVLVCTLMLA